MKKQFDINNDAQVDEFNERYAKACKRLGVPRDTMDVSFEQAAEVLGLSVKSVVRFAYGRGLELSGKPYKGRGVTLDSVVVRAMTKAKTPRKVN